jgi:hypothetical protein
MGNRRGTFGMSVSSSRIRCSPGDEMTSHDVSQVLDSVSNLIGTLIWPALVLFPVVRFREPLCWFFDDLRTAVRSREFR